MFDGTVGRRPRVSLAGKRPSAKEMSKHDFVAAAREERMKRAQNRLLQEMSIKLQAWFRGCRSRNLTRIAFQQAVTAKCNDIETLQRLYTFEVPVPVLTRLLQETIYVGQLWPPTNDGSVPSAVLRFVQQSWVTLQSEWAKTPSSMREWSCRISSLCSLVLRHRPTDLAEFIPVVAHSLPQALYRWSIFPSYGFFDAVVEAWTRDPHHQFLQLVPHVSSLVHTYALHAKFATVLMSLPLSAQQPTLKPWLEQSFLHLPATSSWVTSPWNQAVVVGNLADLISSPGGHANTSGLELLATYASDAMLSFAFGQQQHADHRGPTAAVIAADPSLCEAVQAQVQLLASRSFVLKVWSAALSASSPVFLHSIAQIFASMIILLPPSSPALSTVLFTLSSSTMLLQMFENLSPSPAYSPHWVVFCASLGHYLHTADDQHFSSHFPPRAALTALLNQALYGLLWVESLPAYTRAFEAQLTHMIHVFNELYVRHARVPFCPNEHWLWPTLAIPTDIMQSLDLDDDEPLTVQVCFGTNSRVKLQFVLTTLPQVVPFEARVSLFHSYLLLDKQTVPSRHVFASLIPLRIQRDRIVQDSFQGFQAVESLKGRMQITFINEQGLEEAGVDGGGVFKEYIDTLTKTAFSTEFPYFRATDDRLLYPNPLAHVVSDDAVAHFRFLGRVLAKAVYEEILIEPQFALFFLKKLLGHFNTLDDLRSLDAEMYRHIVELKSNRDVEALGLTFTVASGPSSVHELEPGGSLVPVTNDNVIRYIHKLADFKLNAQIAAASRAFLQGFHDLIPTTWLHLFSPAELQMLIGGSNYDVNVDDWRAHTNYGGGYHPSQPLIQWFWEIVTECTPAERGDLLRFITSCSRQPLLGFKQLSPWICIQQVRVQDDDRLPSSATCMNLLKLPTYSTKEIMRAKLLYAIQAKAGFELS
ncbi:hypothetical protein H310_04319 [Aphanomyces invadans]|uniref:HECT-type E3 ubiquitin transferase n=1 Tax=Aphanomyces invadans TaxID=157072 RepID=A0A024UCD8_9STRA|nr:hypothetical protein H310_04319 [Aphanomyces invadans]ETW03894.1 hypothetical protein H310_04319 [Aphanomyces invadans]|eukprot:XP_008866850.1 hypothetical protein H310_04319 [Aphanomyces invadans]